MTDRPTVNAYVYFRTPTSAPILVERVGAYIAEVGQEGLKHDRLYPGEFVPLLPLPLEMRTAIEEALDLAGETIPYAGAYFDEKWDLSTRFQAAYDLLRPWLDEWLQPGEGVTAKVQCDAEQGDK